LLLLLVELLEASSKATPGCHSAKCYLIGHTCRPAQRIGLKVVRAWAFNDKFPSRPGQYDAVQGKGLDYFIAGAGKRGIRVELALANFWPGEWWSSPISALNVQRRKLLSYAIACSACCQVGYQMVCTVIQPACHTERQLLFRFCWMMRGAVSDLRGSSFLCASSCRLRKMLKLNSRTVVKCCLQRTWVRRSGWLGLKAVRLARLLQTSTGRWMAGLHGCSSIHMFITFTMRVACSSCEGQFLLSGASQRCL
jgi:hypothetical protein